MGVLSLPLFLVCITLCHFLFCNHLKEKERELVALLLLPYGFFVTLYVLRLFLAVPWVGLQCVIVVFPGHTRLLFQFTCSRTIVPCIGTSLFCKTKILAALRFGRPIGK